MGQNDLDPRTIDLNLNMNLAIEILHRYEYVEQVERLNYGTMAKSRKYQGVFEVKSRVKTWQVRGIWSQQLEHYQVPKWGTEPGVRKGKRSLNNSMSYKGFCISMQG